MVRVSEGQCCICGVSGPLSFEHVPPRAAFNDRRIFEAETNKLIGARSFEELQAVKGHYVQRGAGANTLCTKCNNETGHWYGNQYVSWAFQGFQYVQSAPSGSSLLLPFHICPLRVFKQVVCMFASACGPTLVERRPELARFLKNPQFNGFPLDIHVYCYLVAPESLASRQSGITGVLNAIDGHRYLFSEISFPPFGYIFSVDNTPQPDKRLTEITFFSYNRYTEFRSLYLRLSMLPVHSFLPADFRSAEDIRQAYRAVQRRSEKLLS